MSEITEREAKHCVTHHHACDCREYEHEQLRKALSDIRLWSKFSSGESGVMAAIRERAERALFCLKD